MAVYGYFKGPVLDDEPREMREVTFDLSPDELRRVAAFLLDFANLVDTGQWRSSHRHLSEFDRGWQDCDLILMPPSPDPPARVR